MRSIRSISRLIILVTSLAFLLSCRQSFTPKPAGYPKFDIPEKEYRLENSQARFSFEIPAYAVLESSSESRSQAGWTDVVFPAFNGRIHLSYKPVEGNLEKYISDSRNLAYKHTVKADGIEESPFIDREHARYGMIYDLRGEVASSLQFFVTDSTSHFLRGSLYFSCPPNPDSLRPIVDFIREDVVHLIQTTRWKYE